MTMSVERFISACKSGPLSAVQDIVREGANINTEDSDGDTGLVRAMANKHWDIVSWLLDQDTLDMNWKDSEYSETYLIVASDYGAPVSVITCICNKSNTQVINAVACDGSTALDLAVERNHPDIASCLGGREEVTWDMARLEKVARLVGGSLVLFDHFNYYWLVYGEHYYIIINILLFHLMSILV